MGLEIVSDNEDTLIKGLAVQQRFGLLTNDSVIVATMLQNDIARDCGSTVRIGSRNRNGQAYRRLTKSADRFQLSVPFVDNTPATRGSTDVAASIARASALNDASIT